MAVQGNFDVTQTSGVFHNGIDSFVNKANAMLEKLAADVAEADAKIAKLQSSDIKAGYMPDDDNDIRVAITEIQEEVNKNLEVLGRTIDGMVVSTVAVLDAAKFMRLDKDLDKDKQEGA